MTNLGMPKLENLRKNLGPRPKHIATKRNYGEHDDEEIKRKEKIEDVLEKS